MHAEHGGRKGGRNRFPAVSEEVAVVHHPVVRILLILCYCFLLVTIGVFGSSFGTRCSFGRLGHFGFFLPINFGMHCSIGDGRPFRESLSSFGRGQHGVTGYDVRHCRFGDSAFQRLPGTFQILFQLICNGAEDGGNLKREKTEDGQVESPEPQP